MLLDSGVLNSVIRQWCFRCLDTTDDIEVRLCGNEIPNQEGTPVASFPDEPGNEVSTPIELLIISSIHTRQLVYFATQLTFKTLYFMTWT